ncbi:MAG: PD-(D/E)XK nuclease-like domain-containing protein [Oscillospiraceae bacterium]|nr:PD-(D/E)XK nuclease-like domain-containing protein [Oscillospiraceae bacterium]
MTNKEYRAVEAVSRSDLWYLSKTPLHYKAHMDAPEDESTPALIFGSAQHKMVLEPDEFDKEYAVLPSGIDRRTKDGKAAYMTFMEKAAGRTIITEDQYMTILEMLAALKRNPVACELLHGEHEASFFWKDQETGIMCKIRPDVITSYDGKPYLVDYKTTDSCADGHFEASCRRYGYKLQAGMYTEGMFQTMLQEYGFAFIAQEKTAPYAVRVYICDQDFINEGHDLFRTYMGTLKYCDETGDWYGYEGPGHEVSVLGGDNDD